MPKSCPNHAQNIPKCIPKHVQTIPSHPQNHPKSYPNHTYHAQSSPNHIYHAQSMLWNGLGNGLARFGDGLGMIWDGWYGLGVDWACFGYLIYNREFYKNWLRIAKCKFNCNEFPYELRTVN